MRALLLGVLLAIPFYYLKKSVHTETSGSDSVKLKMNAPDRLERDTSFETKVLTPQEEFLDKTLLVKEDDVAGEREDDLIEETEDVEKFQLTDIEQSWNEELKQFLNRLEPVDGDSIHKAYLQEQENYQVVLEGLMAEKHQKTSDEANKEVDELISQLEQKHQEALKEILGAHFEAVHDHHQDHLENFQLQD
jgi:hypothetical protein